LVGSKSVEEEIFVEIGTSQHCGLRDNGFDLVEIHFSFIIPLKFNILMNHLLYRFDSSTKLGVNFLTKLIFPKNDFIAFLL
jgi:hypothetical protein